jgi:hypothetical protein
MKLLTLFWLSAILLAAAEGQSKGTLSKTAPRVIKPVEIPKGAVETEPGTFRFTDAQGKKWIYRKTPFGVARAEDRPAPDQASKAADAYPGVKAIEDGEVIRFERPGPFGVYKWTAKKSELNEMERTVWNRVQTQSAGPKD